MDHNPAYGVSVHNKLYRQSGPDYKEESFDRASSHDSQDITDTREEEDYTYIDHVQRTAQANQQQGAGIREKESDKQTRMVHTQKNGKYIHNRCVFVSIAVLLMISLLSGLVALGLAIANMAGAMQELQTQTAQLSQQLETTTGQLNNLQLIVDGLDLAQRNSTFQLSSLQSSVNTLTTRVNSPVNLYQNCTEEISNCTIAVTNSITNAEGCFTPRHPLNVEVRSHCYC